MSLETYSGLKAAIANWLNRTDLTNEIPDFIRLTESRIAQELRIPTLEKIAYVIPDSEGYATIPSDFLEMKDVFYNSRPLDRISLTMLHSQIAQSGIPTSFAREGREFVFYPTPTLLATDKIKAIYYQSVEALSDSATTNILLQTVPELYLFGALTEAARFLNSDQTRWEMSYQAAFLRIMDHAKSAETAGGTLTMQNGY